MVAPLIWGAWIIGGAIIAYVAYDRLNDHKIKIRELEKQKELNKSERELTEAKNKATQATLKEEIEILQLQNTKLEAEMRNKQLLKQSASI